MKTLFLVLAAVAALVAQAPLPSPQQTVGIPSSGPGSGTVTSVATGCGATGGTITATGTISGTGPCYATGGGTAQAQTATYSPAITLTAGQWACWLPLAANTGSGTTFAPNGLTAHTIVKATGAALVANDIITTAIACAVYDTTGTQWELQNPQTGVTPFAPTQNTGSDNICAAAKDSTLFLDGVLRTVTVTPGVDVSLPNSGTWTTTGGSGTGASGTFTASGGNLATVTIVNGGTGYTGNPTLVPNSGTIGSSASAFSACSNSVNGNAETAFTTTIVITAGRLSNTSIPFTIGLGSVRATGPTLTIKIRLGSVGGTTLFSPGAVQQSSSTTAGVIGYGFRIAALSAASNSTPVAVFATTGNGAITSSGGNLTGNGFPTSIDTSVAVTLVITATWSAATPGNAVILYTAMPS